MSTITETPVRRLPAMLVGVTFAVFAVGALATALMLDGPQASESPYLLATAPALAVPQAGLPAPVCVQCGTVEAVTTLHGAGTAFHVTIRMADGSTRLFEQGRSLALGQRVVVDGQRLTPLRAEALPPG